MGGGLRNMAYEDPRLEDFFSQQPREIPGQDFRQLGGIQGLLRSLAVLLAQILRHRQAAQKA